MFRAASQALSSTSTVASLSSFTGTVCSVMSCAVTPFSSSKSLASSTTGLRTWMVSPSGVKVSEKSLWIRLGNTRFSMRRGSVSLAIS
jgi:hypothetical protein